jgi:hypothetical protein
MMEALLRRLPINHPKRDAISLSLRKRWAGYRGELHLDYHLGFFPAKKFTFLCDLRLIQDGQAFQMDTLVLTSQFLLIIETKNISGNLLFTPHQFIRYNTKQPSEMEKEAFPDPIAQVKRQKLQLNRFLAHHRHKPVPIEYLIAIGNTTSVFETTKGNERLFQTVLRAEHIPERITELVSNYPETLISPQMHRKLTQLFLQEHSSEIPHILSEFEISPSELILTIQCPHCHSCDIQRKYGTWYCPSCRTSYKDAHKAALLDYLLLHHTITNKECREIFEIEIDLAKRLLKSMNLPYQGTTKDRVYELPIE